MAITTNDLTMRIDNTGNMIVGKNAEYIINVLNMLFHMVPGTDSYNPEMGLNIDSRRFRTYTDNTRDTEYESDIATQIGLYTDFIPVNIVSLFTNNALTISITIKVENELYGVQVNATTNTLTAMLLN